MLANHVKQRLEGGKPCFGSLLNFGDPLVAELMASVGFEWLLVDTEHGPIDLATLATMLAAITRYPVAPLVRVHELSEASVKRVLDAGAWGVLAPNVRTRAEAERLVAACRYPPAGVRSLGAGRFALSFKTDAPTYFARANDEILTIVQIEHHEAIRNLDAILSVPGVDACYVGPNDFCASLGLPPSHVDSHANIHIHPVLFPMLLRLAREYGFKRVRLPGGELSAALSYDPRPFASQLGQAFVFAGMEGALGGRPALCPDRTWGLLRSGLMEEGYLLHLLSRLPEGTTEIYFHPTTDRASLPAGRRPTPAHHSRLDFEALTSPRVAQVLRERAIELI